MKTSKGCYRGYQFPPEIISHAVWLYHRFALSFRDVEELLAERGVVVSYETIRQWCQKFGPRYAGNLRRRQGRLGDIWHLDELFVNIQGKRHYLWRAVDQDGDVIDILVQRYRNAHAAKRFFRRLWRGQGAAPWRLVTDRLRSYSAAHRQVMPSVTHDTRQYATGCWGPVFPGLAGGNGCLSRGTSIADCLNAVRSPQVDNAPVGRWRRKSPHMFLSPSARVRDCLLSAF